MNDLTVLLRRRLKAAPERVFAAFTQPELLVQWWGPPGVACPEAEVDLKVGGTYRIANQLPDGSTLWLTGQFEVVEPHSRLVYTWTMGDSAPERVSVQFEAVDEHTEVVLRHERIATVAARDSHKSGWMGCLDGLAELLAR